MWNEGAAMAKGDAEHRLQLLRDERDAAIARAERAEDVVAQIRREVTGIPDDAPIVVQAAALDCVCTVLAAAGRLDLPADAVAS